MKISNICANKRHSLGFIKSAEIMRNYTIFLQSIKDTIRPNSLEISKNCYENGQILTIILEFLHFFTFYT